MNPIKYKFNILNFACAFSLLALYGYLFEFTTFDYVILAVLLGFIFPAYVRPTDKEN